jgi:hypothetical protein
VSRTARHFGYSRPTVYRWLRRFDHHRLETLEDRPSRPVRRRRPTWTLAELVAVRRVRVADPRSGQGHARGAAAARGNRALGLDGGPDPRSAAGHGRAGGTAAAPHPRAPSGGSAVPTRCAEPARCVAQHRRDLVPLDTLAVRPPGMSRPGKPCTARDVVSRSGRARTAPIRERPRRAGHPRRAGRADARPGAGHPRRQRE